MFGNNSSTNEHVQMYLNKKPMNKRRHPRKTYSEGKIPITVGDSRSEQERYLHWQQSRPKLDNLI
jgi:hypothetical protein